MGLKVQQVQRFHTSTVPPDDEKNLYKFET